MTDDDPEPTTPFPPAHPNDAHHECLFLLKRCQDLLAMLDGADANHGAGLDFAKKAIALRVDRRDRLAKKAGAT